MTSPLHSSFSASTRSRNGRTALSIAGVVGLALAVCAPAHAQVSSGDSDTRIVKAAGASASGGLLTPGNTEHGGFHHIGPAQAAGLRTANSGLLRDLDQDQFGGFGNRSPDDPPVPGDQSPCLADWTNDGSVNTADILAFLNDFALMQAGVEVPVDRDPDIAPPAGRVDAADVIAFLNAYAAGC